VRWWWWRLPVAVAMLGLASVAACVVVLGLLGATVVTGFQPIPDPDPTKSGYVGYEPPWEVGDWLVGAAIELTAVAVAVAALWAVWVVLRGPRAKPRPRRWHRVTRVLVWSFVVVVAGFALFAIYQHADNWNEWHALLAGNPSIPHDPRPGQIPAGIAAFLAVPTSLAVVALILRARGRL
jgi:hypothetical protein